jgi:hypothetical protein
MPWSREWDNSQTKKCDRCWDWALSLAEQDDAVVLAEMVLADLLSGDIAHDPLLRSWCKANVSTLCQIMKPFFRPIKKDQSDPT